MIQIATFGSTPIVISKGLEWKVPDKLYILYTGGKHKAEDGKVHDYPKEAKEFLKDAADRFKLKSELILVDAFDMNSVMHTILKIISDERKNNSNLKLDDFVVNLTGGTKPMVAAASTAVYIANVKAIYVHDERFTKNEEIVKILPIPKRPINDSKGNTSKTTSIVLEKIKEFGKCTHQMLRDEVRKDRRIKKKNQRIEHSLNVLSDRQLITIEKGWVAIGARRNPYTGELKKDTRKVTIQLTETGKYFADFPDLVGNLE
jgi:hypothetical protein